MSVLAEQSFREAYRSGGPRLRLLDDSDLPPVLARDERVAAELAQQHAWLVERMLARIAARWPEELDQDWVAGHAVVALRRAAATVEHEEDLPIAGVRAIEERLRTLLGGTEWYREAMLSRARPLCEAWRGVVLSGRELGDHTLRGRLKLSREELAERFVELATVFAVEPAALLPAGVDLQEGIGAAIGGLPGEQQLVVSLYFERQFTLAEIAQVLDMLPVRVQELLGRAAAAISGEAALSMWPVTA